MDSPETSREARRLRAAGVIVVAVLGLSGCAQGATSTTDGTSSNASGLVKSTATLSRGAGRGHGALPFSSASAQSVQPQPAPGTCHAIGSGLYSRPDPHCTPGALNPAVTQATVGRTICQAGWTRTVRPAQSITEAEKAASMAAYGDAGPTSGYEYDHFVPLELGGAVNDARNLWPQPGASPNAKDAVEDELRRQVCDGQMSLSGAQRAIADNWVILAARPSAPAPGGGGSGARCTVSASYNGRHHDYDVYVRSNRPDTAVTIKDAAGRTATWQTDSSGYADVYLRASAEAAGETITAHVGGASCQTVL